MKDLFWPSLLVLIIVSAMMDADFGSPVPSAAPGCVNGVIRVFAPYDIRQALAQAEMLAERVVAFEQAESRDTADIIINYDNTLAHRGNWAEATWGGREVWFDFAAIPRLKWGEVTLHEILHNAGIRDIEGQAAIEAPCDVMSIRVTCNLRTPIVRPEYLTALQRLATCAGQEGR